MGTENLKEGRLPREEYLILLKTVVFPRDGWRCRVPWCRRREHLQGHHIIFRSQQGKDDEDNLLTMCYFCHEDFHQKRKFKIVGAKASEVLFIRPEKGVLEGVLS